MALISRLVPIVIGFLFLAIVAFRTILPGDDPYRCRALLERGSWLDPPKANGSRYPYKQWQPDGCTMHQYSSSDIRYCLDGRDVLFTGDSTTRQILFGLARLLDREKAIRDRKAMPRLPPPHYNFNRTYRGITLHMFWNPFLQTDYRDEEIKQYDAMADERGPAFSVMGVGAWYAKMDKATIAANYSSRLSRMSDILGRRESFLTKPMGVDGIGNQVFFAPPAGPFYTGKDHVEGKVAERQGILRIQDFLRQTNEDDWNFWLAWSILELVEGQNDTIFDPTQTAYHVINSVAETKANIMLNLRCNAKLDRFRESSHAGTCCTDYGNKTLVQLSLVAVALVVLSACLVCELSAPLGTLRAFLNMETGSFIMALLMCYFADRTQILAKGSKLWSYKDFAILTAPCLAVALMTMGKSKSQRKKSEALSVKSDEPFLSRDQTDEWKGWMQSIILIYYWTGSQVTGIYILVRLLVAAYLFQTGYVYTTSFLVKKDFSLRRVLSVLLRLNLLSCSLAYIMNTDWMFYYFSPLVSFWFLVVYITMVIGHRSLNDNVKFVLAKICLSASLVAGVILATPLTQWIFALLRVVFNINWDAKAWEHRVALDLFIVYIGMLTAVARQNIKIDLSYILRYAIVLFGVAVMCVYARVSSRTFSSKEDYRVWHPYVSFIPILAFIAVRNVSGSVRNYHSKAMAWLGRCSLETYTLQFHLLLASDAQGVLLLGFFNGDGSLMGRSRSLAIIVPIFLWMSSATATATGSLVELLLGTTQPAGASAESTPGRDVAYKDLETNPESDVFVISDESDGLEKGAPEYMEMADMGASRDSDHLLSNQDSASASHTKDDQMTKSKRVSSFKSFLTSFQARFVAVLLCMWMFNLLSPGGFIP